MYYYLVDGERFDDEEELADSILQDLDSDYYDDYLNELYSSYEIEGIRFSPSDILKNGDEDAYWQGYDEYVDALNDQLVYDLRHMNAGSSDGFYGCIVDCREDSEDDDDEEEPETPAQHVEQGIFGDLLFNEL